MGLQALRKVKPKQCHCSTSKVSHFLCTTAVPQPFSPVRHQVFPSDHCQMPSAGQANLSSFSDSSVWAPATLKSGFALLEISVGALPSQQAPLQLQRLAATSAPQASWALQPAPGRETEPAQRSAWLSNVRVHMIWSGPTHQRCSGCRSDLFSDQLYAMTPNFCPMYKHTPFSFVFHHKGKAAPKPCLPHAWVGRKVQTSLHAALELPPPSGYSLMPNPLSALAEFTLLEHQ